MGSAHGVATALNRLGDLARDRGELATAERLHGEALSLRRGRGDPWVLGLSLTGLARDAAARGDHDQTIVLAIQSLEALHHAGASRDAAAALIVLAGAASATGRARVGARLLAAVARVYPEGSAIGAEQASFDAVVAAARAALGDSAFEAGWIEGQLLTFDQAIEAALSLGEPDQAAAEFPAAQSSGPPLSVLTRREREVAALIARGLTNREIANELVISEMTADSHVSHILRKLGVRSRAQVASWAVERGLTAGDAR